MDIAFGGAYAATSVDTGEVSVFRLLDFSVGAVHLTLYKQRFDAVPSAADVRALSPHIWHVPIDARSLLRDEELQLICTDPLTAHDLLGYVAYLDAMGVAEDERDGLVQRLIGFSHDPPMRLRLAVVDDELRVEVEQTPEDHP